MSLAKPFSKKAFTDPLNLFTKKPNAEADAINAAPTPIPQKPVTASDAAVVDAEREFAQSNLLKKSVKKTIYAGDTGGYSPAKPTGV